MGKFMILLFVSNTFLSKPYDFGRVNPIARSS